MLLVVVVAGMLSFSLLAARSTTVGIAENIQNHAQAHYTAETGLRLAIAYVRRTDDWRSQQTHGAWVTDASFAGGTFTVVGEDGVDQDGDGVISIPAEGDGNLLDDEMEPVTLCSTGRFGGTTHMVHAVVTPMAGSNGLVGHWKLDELEGTLAADSSGQNNVGTLTNTSPFPSWEPGRVGGALHFDGYDDFVRVADDASLDLSDEGTLALWVWMESGRPFAGLIHKGDETSFSDEAYSLYVGNSRELYFGLSGTSSSATITSNARLASELWYHIAAVWDVNGMYLYVDGALDSSSTSAISVKDSPGGLNIGAQLPEYYNGTYRNLPFDGLADDVRVYNRALNADEVASLSNLHSAGGETGYAVRWE